MAFGSSEGREAAGQLINVRYFLLLFVGESRRIYDAKGKRSVPRQ